MTPYQHQYHSSHPTRNRIKIEAEFIKFNAEKLLKLLEALHTATPDSTHFSQLITKTIERASHLHRDGKEISKIASTLQELENVK